MAYAADLYAEGFASDPMDYQAGHRYRRLFLEPGSSLPEDLLLENFLGRKPNSRALLKQLTSE
jgi:Zn-dependent oligopeptidase